MMTTTQTWAKTRVNYWWNKCCDIYQNDSIRNNPPIVRFSNRLVRTAGLAHSGLNYIKLSNHFLEHEDQSKYDKTIAHEVSHIFADRHYKRKCRHDARWRNIMESLGFQPDRCHTYQSTKPIKRQSTSKYRCACGHVHQLTNNRLTRMRNGTRYTCMKCKSSANFHNGQII